MSNTDERICIIGAGPAGLSSAMYLEKKGYSNYVIYEKFKSLFAANHEKWIDGKIKEIKKDYFVVIPDSEDELFGIADEVYINSKDVAGNSLTKNLKKSDHIRVMYNPNSLEFKDEKWQIGIAFAVYKYNSKGELIME